MSIEALGATKPHRLSFARLLVRRMQAERWKITLRVIDVNDQGVGRLVYDIEANEYLLHFVIRSDDVPEELRTGRLSESRFDGMAILCHGPLDWERIDAEMREIQKRSAGRGSHQSLGWTLCSRSSRSFAHVVDQLAAGQQPDIDVLLDGASYLLRNNGYYGNGRHGTRPWASLPDDHPLAQPYFPEMISLYLLRQFGFDLVEEIARQRSDDAVLIDDDIKRFLGIGNATGQGMSTFPPKWPHWMQCWNDVRETAFATVLDIAPNADDLRRAHVLLERAEQQYARESSDEGGMFVGASRLADDLAQMTDAVTSFGEGKRWRDFHSAVGGAHPEALSVLRSVLTEVHGKEVDHLAERYRDEMGTNHDTLPHMTVESLLAIIATNYGWVDEVIDVEGFHDRFFYRSAEHGEQRVGERFVDEGVANETFTAVAHAVNNLRATLQSRTPTETIARFLIDHPEQRYIAERVQATQHSPYAEIRTDISGANWTAANAGRFVLATFGMDMARARTPRWVHGIFFHGAPLPSDLTSATDIDWLYPPVPVRS